MLQREQHMAEPFPSRSHCQPSTGRRGFVAGEIDALMVLPVAVPSAFSGEAHQASLAKRLGPPKERPIPEEGGGGGGGQSERPLDKSFGYGKNSRAKYELGKEVGRGHFGHTCSARARKGEIKGQLVTVKVLKAFVHGDENLFINYPELEEALVWVYFHSNLPKFNTVECWGPLKGAVAPCPDLMKD